MAPSSAKLLLAAGLLVLVAEPSAGWSRYRRCIRPTYHERPPYHGRPPYHARPPYPVQPPYYPVRPPVYPGYPVRPVYPVYPVYPVRPPTPPPNLPPTTAAPTTTPPPTTTTTTTTTTATATTTPAPLPADLQNFFNALNALPLLFFLNMFANTLPPVPPPNGGEIPIPLARMQPRSLPDELSADDCVNVSMSEDTVDMLEELKEGVAVAGNVKDHLESLDVCEMKQIAEELPEFEEGRKMVETFMLTRDTKSNVKRAVYQALILAACNQKNRASPRARSRRQFNLYNMQQMFNGNARICSYLQSMVQSYPQYRQIVDIYCPTAPPPPPPNPNDEVVQSVLDNVLPMFGIQSSEDLVRTMRNAYSMTYQAANSYYSLIAATRFRDYAAACELLYLYTRSESYALRVMASIAFYRYRCSVPTYATTPAPPATTTKPAAPSTAAPTTTTSTSTTTTTTATTTASPPARCGQSTKLDRLNNVATERFFITSRIVGGSSSGSCSLLPWQVRLKIGSLLCGGSVIDEYHVLTAAHCIPKEDDENYVDTIEVIAGDFNIDNPESSEQNRVVNVIDQVDVHENFTLYYDGRLVHDIALITLKQPLDLSHPCVEPVCLKRSFDHSGKSCTVSGWGSLEENGELPSELQHANVMTVHGSACETTFSVPSSYPPYVADTRTQLCAGYRNGGIDSCEGDSGGPLVCRDDATNSYYQAGVVSYGKGCARSRYPGIYTDVTKYYDWIQGKL